MIIGRNTSRYLITDNKRHTKILLVRLRLLGYTCMGGGIEMHNNYNDIDTFVIFGRPNSDELEHLTEEFLDDVKNIY